MNTDSRIDGRARRAVTWGLHALRLALWLAWPLGLIWGVVRFSSAGHAIRIEHLLPPVAVGVVQMAVAGFVALVLFLGASEALRTRLSRPWLRDTASAALVLAAPAAWLGLLVNRHYLPDVLEPASIAGNLAMLGGLALVVPLVAKALGRWRRDVERHSRGPAVWSLSILGLAAVLPLLVAATLHATAGPNVIVLLIDALRADHLVTYGYERPTSVHLDRFAEDAVVFEQAISASTFTKTSIASLFTGLDPHHHGVFRGNRNDTPDRITSDAISPRHTTLAEFLAQQGLLCLAWVQNPHLQAFMGFGQGFHLYRDWPGSIQRINGEFLRWHRRHGRLSRFFAYLHYLDLHDPYQPPARLDGLYGRYSDFYDDLERSTDGPWEDAWSTILREIREGERELSPEDVEQLRADYDEEIHGIDEEIGRFLEELRARGIYDESVIVITSDHGDGFMEHGFISHSTTPYEELIHVPLMIKLPNSRYAGTRIQQQVRAVDVMPTLLDVLGAPPPVGIDGRSLLPLMRGDVAREGGHPDHAFVEDTGAVGLRTPDWKVLNFLFEGRWEIYDLRADPHEQHDLSVDPPAEAVALQALVAEAVADRARTEAGVVPLDETTIESLRALGYLE